MSKKIQCVEARYELKLLLRDGDYGKTEHEVLSATVNCEADAGVENDELITEAMRICWQNSIVAKRRKAKESK